jgi:hypothetical protein
MKNINKYILAGLVFIFIFIIFFYITKTKIESGKIIESAKVIAQQSECKPQGQVCKIRVGKFIAEIEIDKNVFYLKPFNVNVRIDKSEIQNIKSVYVDFKMKGMDMGVNRFNLHRKDTSEKLVNWEGKALLPICVTGRVDWFSEVEILTNKEKYIFSLPLEVKKSNN